MSVIEIKGVTKYYKDTRALDNISLMIETNKIYGLLGRNGAGKTTLLNILTNKIFPTEGDIFIDGDSVFENDKVLNNIFYMTEKNLYPENLKIKEIFKWTKKFYHKFNIEYANNLAKKFELDINKKVKGLSTGYGSIFKVIIALASNADILIFDEPVLGLDANHRDMLYKELISSYSENPKTIILSTHLIEEIEDILEDVILIKNGKLIMKSSVEQLLDSAYTVSGDSSNVDIFIKGKKFIGENVLGRFKSVIVLDSVQNKNDALAKELDLKFSKVELQKLFIALTN